MTIPKISHKLLEKIPYWVLVALILAAVGFVIFNSRQIFYYQYDSEYFENLYYHSQWNISNSTRGISDGLLYQFVGYRLVQGENPFYLNYEAPPFAKYLYGLSEYYLNNPYWVSLLLYLGSIIVFYLLASSLFKDKKFALLTLLIFSTTPFIATQVRDTMLDLPLTAFFLTHTFFFVLFLNKQSLRDGSLKPKIITLGLAGTFLGLATGTKIGVYSPWIILFGLPLVFLASKKAHKYFPRIVNPVIYLGSVFAGYCLAYISYFIHHKNPIPWLKLHQKQVDFYLSPGGEIDYLNQWKGIFLNTYQGWWGIEKISLGDWSPILPLGVLAAGTVLILSLKRKEKPWIYISGITLIFLVVNTFISFWPRYLMPAVPGFILLIAYFARKYWWILVILSILNLPFFVNSLSTKNYRSSNEAISSFFSKRAYRELYRSIDPDQRKTIPEDQFIKTLENFYRTIGVRKIDLQVKEFNLIKDGAEVNYQMDYLTDYGKISFTPVLVYKDIHNQTRLIWKWDYLWPNYRPETQIIVEKTDLKDILSREGKSYTEKGTTKVVEIIVRHVQWPQTLDLLSNFVKNQSSLDVNERLRWVIPDDFPRFVGLFNKDLGQGGLEQVTNIKGVKVREIDPDVSTDIFFENSGIREYIVKSGMIDLETF